MSYIYISQYLQNAHQKSTERYIWALYYKSLTWMFRPFWAGFPYFSLPFGVTSAEVASFPAAPGWRQVLKESPRWSDMPRRVGGRSCEQFHSMGKPTQNHGWLPRVSKRSSKLDHFLTFRGQKCKKKILWKAILKLHRFMRNLYQLSANDFNHDFHGGVEC